MVLVSMEMIQAGTWDLLAVGNGLHLREQGAKSRKSQSSSCCAFDPGGTDPTGISYSSGPVLLRGSFPVPHLSSYEPGQLYELSGLSFI